MTFHPPWNPPSPLSASNPLTPFAPSVHIPTSPNLPPGISTETAWEMTYGLRRRPPPPFSRGGEVERRVMKGVWEGVERGWAPTGWVRALDRWGHERELVEKHAAADEKEGRVQEEEEEEQGVLEVEDDDRWKDEEPFQRLSTSIKGKRTTPLPSRDRNEPELVPPTASQTQRLLEKARVSTTHLSSLPFLYPPRATTNSEYGSFVLRKPPLRYPMETLEKWEHEREVAGVGYGRLKRGVVGPWVRAPWEDLYIRSLERRFQQEKLEAIDKFLLKWDAADDDGWNGGRKVEIGKGLFEVSKVWADGEGLEVRKAALRVSKEESERSVRKKRPPVGSKVQPKRKQDVDDEEEEFTIKYFYEASFNDHMDIRYAQRGKYERAEERLEVLRDLLSAWDNFTETHQVNSWISHGTLLGWFWGRHFLTWDYDIDVQIPLAHLHSLHPFNQTLHASRFLFDLNPHYIFRNPQPFNTIDARFIDTRSGLYIDVTALALVDAPQDAKRLEKNRGVGEGGGYVCKSPHAYTHAQLFPLVRTRMEGVSIWRPNGVKEILEGEYGLRSMTRRMLEVESHGWFFDEEGSGRWERVKVGKGSVGRGTKKDKM
ncbi:hypothetical protein HDV05_001490 [Chytridiales sp. JEL 0842]|nr:hypothetical protein HDV05_001490 [Chytridiales sp. JEL 0842]